MLGKIKTLRFADYNKFAVHNASVNRNFKKNFYTWQKS